MAAMLLFDVADIIAGYVMMNNYNNKPQDMFPYSERGIYFDSSLLDFGSSLRGDVDIYTRYEIRHTMTFSPVMDKAHKWTVEVTPASDKMEGQAQLEYMQIDGTDEFFVIIEYESRELIYKYNARNSNLTFFRTTSDVSCDKVKNIATFEMSPTYQPGLIMSMQTFVNEKNDGR